MVSTNFLVKKRKISQIDSIPYTGEDYIDTFKFEFDGEWEGLDKTLVIVSGNQRYNVPLLNDECVVPFEFYQIKGNVLIGLFGTDGEYQTLATGWLPIYVEEDSYEVGVEPENLPTPTQWDLYVTEINELLRQCQASEDSCSEILSDIQGLKTELEAEVAEIERKLEHGDFKGDKGDKGDPGNDGYTPVRGTDYWTEEDKQSIDNDIENKLSAYFNKPFISFKIENGNLIAEVEEYGNN